MKDLSKGLKIAGVYTALILGAGFASGQELLNFFVRFGGKGYLGLIISGFIFALCGYAVLDICVTNKIENYNCFSRLIFGKTIGKIVEYAVGIFLLVLFSTMLAAGGAIAQEAFLIPPIFGVLAIGFFCFVVLMLGIDALVEINTILAPIMVIGGIFIGLYSVFLATAPVFFAEASDNGKWAYWAIIYSGYNMVTAVTVLSAMSKYNTSRKTAKYGGLIGGISMTLLGLCLSIPLFIHFDSVNSLEMPMLYIVNQYGQFIRWFYIFILISAIITTALGNGFAFVEWIKTKTTLKAPLIKLFTVLFAMGISGYGFSGLVANVYPLFGFFGILQILCITKYYISNSRKNFR